MSLSLSPCINCIFQGGSTCTSGSLFAAIKDDKLVVYPRRFAFEVSMCLWQSPDRCELMIPIYSKMCSRKWPNIPAIADFVAAQFPPKDVFEVLVR